MADADSTHRLIMRPVEPSDYEFLRALFGDADTVQYWRHGLPLNEDEVRRMIQESLDSLTHPGIGVWVMVEKSSGEAVGVSGAWYEDAGRSIRLSCVLLPGHRGRAYAVEFSRWAIRNAFDHTGVERVWATVRPENASSIRALEKTGMARTGYRPEDNRFVYTIERPESYRE